jgi:polyribonucleotide 5'-hydroxyl-kinase
MRVYANLHIALEQMRVRALREIRGSPVPPGETADSDPPKVLVLGPEHSGKTTICKVLTNYAVRAGQSWSPFLVNVDPSEVSVILLEKIAIFLRSQGGWSVPGALSVAPVYGPIPTASPSNTLGTAATTAPMSLAANALLPLAYWYGHAETKKNPLLVERHIRNLGENINERFALDSEGKFWVPMNLPRVYLG